MSSIRTVTTAPAATRLTTIEAVKIEMAIEDGQADTWIIQAIARATTAIGTWLNRDLARATESEQFRLAGRQRRLGLARYPVESIATIVEDGVTLSGSDYELEHAIGWLHRLDGADNLTFWPATKIVVAYVGGYVMPGQSGRNLPEDIERAAILLIKAWWFARNRDSMVKAEIIPDVLETQYWVDAQGESAGLPPDVTALLASYRKWGHE